MKQFITIIALHCHDYQCCIAMQALV